MIWTILSFLAGVAVAWVLRRSMRTPSARMIEEVYGRKVRFAEQEREQAVRELNANRVEMSTFDERFKALDKRIEGLSGELERAQKGAAASREEAAHATAALAAHTHEVGDSRRTQMLAVLECAAALEEREQAEQARIAAEDEARARRAEAAEVQGRFAALEKDRKSTRLNSSH